MLRILRAFAWMRWRMLMNSFEKTGSRDVLERFSIAAEKLGPIITVILILPPPLLLVAGSIGAGYAVAQGNQYSLLFTGLRSLLIFVPILAVISPLSLPSGDRTNPVRLLLLPIPRSTLYVAQAASAFGEVWVVLMLPVLVGIPLGLLAGGALVASAFALVAGVLLLVTTVGPAALPATVLHLVVRDRRRAELFAVVFIIVISMAGLLPGLLQGRRERTSDGKRVRKDVVLPAWVESTGRRVVAVYPTELYARGTRSSASGNLLAARGGPRARGAA